MNGPCFRCFVGQHDRCEGVAHPLGLLPHACECDGCGLLNAAPAVAPRSPGGRPPAGAAPTTAQIMAEIRANPREQEELRRAKQQIAKLRNPQ